MTNVRSASRPGHGRRLSRSWLTGHVDSWSPGTGSTFALLPPDNATGNFTKVVQRVPVKIVLDHNKSLRSLVGLACRSRRPSIPARSRTSNQRRVTEKTRAARPAPAATPSTADLSAADFPAAASPAPSPAAPSPAGAPGK